MALQVERRSVAGEAAGTVTLDEVIFGIQPNVPVLHQVVTAQLAAARAGTQSTKTRAEVSGGGKKPFKQKGTGRARQGSERAPHFTGGGIALGPKPRSYRQRTPRKMIQLALKSALSDRASDGKIAVVEGWNWDAPSTKAAREALSALGLEGRVLVVLGRDDEHAYKSFRNLTNVQIILAGELNAYDVLCNDWIVFTDETLPGADVSADAPASERSPDASATAAAAPNDPATEAAPNQPVTGDAGTSEPGATAAASDAEATTQPEEDSDE